MGIALEEAKNVDKRNDRLNLVLLKYKAGRSPGENRQYDKLNRIYPDNQTFEEGLIELLKERKLLYLVNGEMEQNEKGYVEYINKDDSYRYWETTEKGELAIKSRLFPSESAKEIRETRFRLFQIVGILIAALGGLITLFSFLHEQLKSSL